MSRRTLASAPWAGRRAATTSKAYLASLEVSVMLWFLGALLIVFWVIGIAFKVTTGLIHVALIAGLILFILGFFRGRRPTATP
jgi:VIT1/CCC1 family predicted Fe2+/Mn2+ transporter